MEKWPKRSVLMPQDQVLDQFMRPVVVGDALVLPVPSEAPVWAVSAMQPNWQHKGPQRMVRVVLQTQIVIDLPLGHPTLGVIKVLDRNELKGAQPSAETPEQAPPADGPVGPKVVES